MNFLPEETINTLRRAYDQGLSIRSGAIAAGVNKGTAERYFTLWRREPESADPLNRSDRVPPAIADTGELVCYLQPSLKAALVAAAQWRKVSLSSFAGFLLETIVEEGLIGAILEEETGTPPIQKTAIGTRKCLSCGQSFWSEHKYNRLCRTCNAQARSDGADDRATEYISNTAAVVSGGMGGFVRPR